MQKKISEEDKLEKTFYTFHALNMFLQQQYRKFLMKNHDSCPTSSITFPEVNVMIFSGRGHGPSHG